MNVENHRTHLDKGRRRGLGLVRVNTKMSTTNTPVQQRHNKDSSERDITILLPITIGKIHHHHKLHPFLSPLRRIKALFDTEHTDEILAPRAVVVTNQLSTAQQRIG